MSAARKRAGWVLALVLTVLVVVVLVRRHDPGYESPAGPVSRAGGEPLEFRRVLAAADHACEPTRPPTGPDVRCDLAGTQYTLGARAVPTSAWHGVKVSFEGPKRWVVDLELSDAGVAAFRKLAAELAATDPPRDRLAILVDDRIVTVRTVGQLLQGGDVWIDRGFTEKQAGQLVDEIVN
ncbi:SecDF P1 head subdomain-containing protein [Kribbella sp. NPDC051587]|uniref:SecDF P1 head subdomain-containing protein n=1 Tax=Kribbella sp. NPDC051587 TaxID=3364119 RepID=UPI00378A0283